MGKLPRVATLALSLSAVGFFVSAVADDDIRKLVIDVASADLVKAHAAEMALAQAGESAVEPILQAMEDKDADPVHRKSLGIVLGKIKSPKANERLMHLFGVTKNPYVMQGILSALHGQDAPEVKKFLTETLKNENKTVRAMSIRNLAETRDPIYLQRAVLLLWDEEDFVRTYAIRAIGKYESLPEDAMPAIEQYLQREHDEELRADLLHILAKRADQEHMKRFLKAYLGREPSAELRRRLSVLISEPLPQEGSAWMNQTRPKEAAQGPTTGIAPEPETGLPSGKRERGDSRVVPGGASVSQPTSASRDVARSYKDDFPFSSTEREPVKDKRVFFWQGPVTAVLAVAAGAYFWLRRKTKRA